MPADLNPRQREAVTAPAGPLLVLAGAGSGKTRVITHRIAWLIAERGVEPRCIAGLTFTNKAAGEMRERLDALVGAPARGVMLMTFHALGALLLRRWGDRTGLGRDFTILDDDDSEALVRDILHREGRQGDEDPAAILARIGLARSAGLTAAGYRDRATGPAEELAAEIFLLAEKEKRKRGAADFDDLIELPTRLLSANPDLQQEFHGSVRHVLVDEYQDTSPAQYAFLRELVGPERDVTCVGDPDQSIYRWRGADIRNILEFERDFPDARTVTLEQNYRSTGRILEAASELIAHNRGRKEKRLWTEGPAGRPLALHIAPNEEGEARFAAETVARGLSWGDSPRDYAVLYRTHAQSRALEEAFARAGIPCAVVGGTRFYARREVKDALSYLRLVANPRDASAFMRAAGAPPRGIGETTVGRVISLAASAGLTVPEFLARAGDSLPPRARKPLGEFSRLLADLAAACAAGSWTGALGGAVENSGYADWLSRQPDGRDRMDNIRELLSAARAAEEAGTTLAEWLERIALLSGIDLLRGDEPAVTLMTLHNAKGLEFSRIFICGLENGLLPHASAMGDDEEMEEERRLFYVGLTRAREYAVLTMARSRRTWDRSALQSPSRFLRELPARLVAPVASASDMPVEEDAPRLDSLDEEDFGTDPEVLRPGMHVRHPRFGPGTVLKLSGSGDELSVVVSFPRWGRRTFLARAAKLEPHG